MLTAIAATIEATNTVQRPGSYPPNERRDGGRPDQQDQQRQRLQRVHRRDEQGRRHAALERREEDPSDDLHRADEAGDPGGVAERETAPDEIRNEMHVHADAEREAEEPQRQPAEARVPQRLTQPEASLVLLLDVLGRAA